MNTLRIGYLTGQYPRATDKWIQREVRALRGIGVSVDTFSIRRPKADVKSEELDEIRAETTYVLRSLFSLRGLITLLWLPIRRPKRVATALWLAIRTRRPGVGGFVYQFVYLLEAIVLAGRVRKMGIGHLHNHFADSSLTVSMLAAQIANVGFSFTLHGPAIFFEPRVWRLDEKIARAKFVATISYFCRSQAAIFSDPVHLDKLKVVHCGVDTADISPVRHSPEVNQVLFVGRLVAEKGVEHLIEAMKTVVESHPNSVLKILGDGPDRARLIRHAEIAGLGDHVRFGGMVDAADVAKETRKSAMIVLPSYAEGVPVSLMEAMANGLPAVATAVGGVTELVSDGTTGFIVRPGDATALSSRICELLGDSELRAIMGKSGQNRVALEFSSLGEAKKLKQHFLEYSIR